MSCPTISIKFIGTSCNCCSGNTEKNDLRVAYRADTDCFIAVEPSAQVSATARLATIKALETVIQQNYAIELKDIPIELDKAKLPSYGEVKAIEGIAQQKFKDSQNEIKSPPNLDKTQ